MNKPTDDGPSQHELMAIVEHAEENNLEPDEELYLAGKAAGIAHGWRECIEALREAKVRNGHPDDYIEFNGFHVAIEELERLAKERGHGL